MRHNFMAKRRVVQGFNAAERASATHLVAHAGHVAAEAAHTH
jgi:hypothetical protein